MNPAAKAILGASLIVLTGCTTTHTTVLSKTEFLLAVHSHSSADRPSDLIDTTLQAAANRTLQSGYRYFAIVSASDRTRTVTARTPILYPSVDMASHGSLQMDQVAGDTPFSKKTLRWLGDQVRVRMFAEGAPEADRGDVFDAQSLSRR